MATPFTEKRKPVFIERLSFFLVAFSAIGALLVMIDPVVAFTTPGGTTIKIGGDGFAEQMKGAVIMLVLIGGFTAVINFWIGMTNQGARAQESVNVIAQAAAPAQAAAVAAATGVAPAPIVPAKVDTMNVSSQNTTVNEAKP